MAAHHSLRKGLEVAASRQHPLHPTSISIDNSTGSTSIGGGVVKLENNGIRGRRSGLAAAARSKQYMEEAAASFANFFE